MHQADADDPVFNILDPQSFQAAYGIKVPIAHSHLFLSQLCGRFRGGHALYGKRDGGGPTSFLCPVPANDPRPLDALDGIQDAVGLSGFMRVKKSEYTFGPRMEVRFLFIEMVIINAIDVGSYSGGGGNLRMQGTRRVEVVVGISLLK